MDGVLMLVFTGVGALAAVGSAVVAIVQARQARNSKRDAAEAQELAEKARDESARLASEANEAFVRQAEAQEEANRLKKQEMEPDDWQISHLGGSRYRGANTSKRVLFVQSFDVQPDEAVNLVTIQTRHEDGRYEYGDSFDFYVTHVMSASPDRLSIRYRRDDDNEDDWRTLHIGV